MRRLRQIHCGAAWPPPVLVAIFVFVYVVFNAGIWLLGRTSTNLHEAISEMSEFPQFFAVMIGAAAALHVLCRLVRFHPALNLRYASWLALSPWTAARPLPIGPIHPVWQDAAVLAILAALARWQAHIDP
ncbi:MAG: hypothetical protein ABSA47_19120, partial [Verrucomicrobiota bacterium]